MKLHEKNFNSPTNNFLDAINSILNKHAPLKKVNKYKLRLKQNLSMISGIQKSICIKNKLLKKFISKKDLQIKAVFHEQYKTYRTLLFLLMKQSMQILYTKYFENQGQIQIFWKGGVLYVGYDGWPTKKVLSFKFQTKYFHQYFQIFSIFIYDEILSMFQNLQTLW